MRVLVLWADERSTNLGVRALATGCAALAERAWSDVEVEYASFGGTRPIGDWRRLVRTRLERRSATMSWLATFDAILDTRAGDSFADVYGLKRLTTQSLLAELAVQAGTPVAMAPQTIGPFGTARGRAVARWSMRRSSVVMARDSTSAQFAARLGRPVDVLATDVVFALPRPQVPRTRDVLVNVSGLLWAPNDHADHLRYRQVVLEVCRGLQAAGRTVSLLAHVLDSTDPDNDVPAAREAAGLLSDLEVLVPADLDQVRELTASAALVVGSRMHACLNALSTGTPALPLAYSRKFAPLLADLGWRHTIDLRSAADPAGEVLALAAQDLDEGVREVNTRADQLLVPAIDALRGMR